MGRESGVCSRHMVLSSFRSKLIATAIFVVLAAAAAYFLPIVPLLGAVSQWVGNLGFLGILFMAVLMTVGSLCLLPASPFVVGSGVVFGFWGGCLSSTIGIVLGATTGFFLSRWFLRQDIADRLRRNPTYRAIDLAIADEGWKIVALLRLSPMPFGLANYFYGLTGVSFWPYLLTSILGSLPSTALFCYLGSAGKASLSEMANGRFGHSPGEYALLILGVSAVILTLTLLPRFTQRAIKKYGLDSAKIEQQASSIEHSGPA
jgi:uncharacterized membrane protein YdjX (TVP38/TMEM64 family)